MVEVKEILADAELKMSKCVEHFEIQLSEIRAGKASVNILNGISVESYGSEMPINQVASVTVPDSRSILIQPWDKKLIPSIEKAIIDSNIGLTPSNNGDQIRLNVPPLTEERRKALVKQVKGEVESTKIALRNSRRDSIEQIKKAQKDGLAEDIAKDSENEVQKLVDKFSKSAEALSAAKEKEIMTV
ncbi:MAG: ribosome recycling factor [Rikenellaceae bacterium]